MKKLRNVLLIGLVLLTILPVLAGAVAPYKTYTYSPEGELLNSPNAYVPNINIDAEYMGLGDVPFSAPKDLFVAPDGRIYIADSGNNRIIVLTKYYKLDYIIDSFENDWGVPDRLSSPNGVFVNEKHIYICDTNNCRIVRYNVDGTFDKVIDQPESNLFEEGSIYKPIACAVDAYDRIFVVSSTTYQGVIVINDDAEFFGFIGAQSESLSPIEILWRRFKTKEQLEEEDAILARELNNITIDSDNFIYVTTSNIDDADLQAQITSKDPKTSPIKKLNASGVDVLKRNGTFAPSGEVRLNFSPTATIQGASTLVDVAIGPVKTWSIIDQKRSKVYTYDEYGNLLFAFGDKGSTKTSQIGNVGELGAIAYQPDGTLLLLDVLNNCIVAYRRTEYGDLLINALQNDADRKFDMAEHDWTEILKRNINYSIAYLQLGKSAARNGEYEEAMELFKKIKNTEDYSAAFKEVRSAWASENFWIIPVVAVIIILLVAKFFSYAAKVNHRATLKLGRRSVKEEVLYAFHIIFHPFDGFWDLKHERRGSMKSALAILLFTIIAFFYKSIGTSYIFNPDDSQMLTVLGNIAAVVVPLLLWVIANWCITTLFEGEGSMKDIFIATCYSLTPLPLLMIPSTIASNFLITSEAGILSLLNGIAFVWLGLLLILGMMVTHDYSVGKNVLACIMTIVGMVFIMFIAVLFSTLMTQIVGFISDIITEISFRM
ncbi:MAG: YIP1 family protein [Clostridia bacterium]|nr:YIP1 family protein [Clostridia bacterium]